MTLLSDIIDANPSNYEEVAKKKGKESTTSRRMMSKMRYQDLKRSPQWICKIQHAVVGNIVEYKARFIARGFSQKEDIDYEEKFAPLARYTSLDPYMQICNGRYTS